MFCFDIKQAALRRDEVHKRMTAVSGPQLREGQWHATRRERVRESTST